MVFYASYGVFIKGDFSRFWAGDERGRRRRGREGERELTVGGRLSGGGENVRLLIVARRVSRKSI